MRSSSAPRETKASFICAVQVITWFAKRMLSCSSAAASRTIGCVIRTPNLVA
jgi:hypothetical protein